MYVKARYQAHVFRCKVTHQHTSDRPVHHVHTAHVTAADSHIVALVFAGCVQAWQIVRVVTEVGVHLEDVLVVALQCPLKAGNVSRAQSQFAATLHQVQLSAKLIGHQTTHNGSCTIRRSIVDHQYMETLLQPEYRAYDFLDILLLIIGWYDYYTIALLHIFSFKSGANIRISEQNTKGKLVFLCMVIVVLFIFQMLEMLVLPF